MIIRAKGLTKADIESAVRLVNIDNERKFSGVLMGKNLRNGGAWYNASIKAETRNGTTLSVKIGALTGSPAARLAPSGRRGPWACWFTFRDVLGALYGVHPEAVVRTALATYRSQDDFMDKFPDTYYGPTGDTKGGLSTQWPGTHRKVYGELCYDLGYHDQHDH